MKIAFDGGAFQQGIAAGIYNVAVGLMNEIRRQTPATNFVLVADPRFGPVQKALTDTLDFRPEVLEGMICPSFGTSASRPTTDQPRVTFEVDGRFVSARSDSLTGALSYEGPAPNHSFRIHSRADSPSDVSGSPDTRLLGVSVQEIRITDPVGKRIVRFDDQKLKVGFHAAESTQRWTNGNAAIPAELFNPGDTKVDLHLHSTTRYRVAGGLFDSAYAELCGARSRLELQAETSRVEAELLARGVHVYIANHFVPARFLRLKTFSVLYDIIPVIFPRFFMTDALKNFEFVVDSFKRSEHVFSISETSRVDAVDHLGISSDRVTHMGIDVGNEFQPTPPKTQQIVRDRYGLGNAPYILSVGTLEPRKNHAELISAFHEISDRFPDVMLVLIGKPGWGTDALHQLVADLSLRDRVRFLHNVATAELPAFYSGARLTAYPSLYEGFGLPVLEAMACGCPVVTSNCSSMAEVAGDAAVLVDPASSTSIATGMSRVLSDSELRGRLIASGTRRRQQYSWAKSATRVIDVMGLR